MTNTTISPFVVSGVEQVELTNDKGEKKKAWRKEILPAGTRKYKGEVLDFTKINPACVQAFEDGAVDAVPFVLTTPDNKHPKTGEEIKLLEGDLNKLELANDGRLFGYFDLSDDVVKTIRKSNGKLGVSTRIDVDYERPDLGKKYDFALRHVCATTAPHIKGMSPWESVELTDEELEGETLDFSTEVIEEKPETDKKETGDDLVAVNIPKEQFDKLMAFIGDVEKGEEIAKRLNGEGGEGGSGEVQLTEAASKRIELAEESAKRAYALAEEGQKEAAAARWETRKRDLALGGVPPVLLELAEPVMKLHKPASIELTDGDGNKETVDATKILSEVLDAAKGMVNLSEEAGHGVTGNQREKEDKEFEEFVKDFASGLNF